MKNLIAVIILLALCATVGADCRRVVRVVDHRAQVIVEPVVAAVFAPVAVAAYSVGYSDNHQLVEEVKQLRAQVAALTKEPGISIEAREAFEKFKKEWEGAKKMPTAGPPVEDKGSSGEHPAIGILKAKCASCHDGQVSKAKGAGFTLFEGGQLAKLSDRQVLKVQAKTYSGAMPPDPRKKLTDEEVGELMSLFDPFTKN